ncbi:MAG: ATP-binding protein [Candidatus Diapherotrites archaeon]|nr:ATP-binding protein [Candidatus Diapherotrites archaeon]
MPKKSVSKSKSEPFLSMKFKTTADIKVPKTLAEQVIGQERAIDIIKKAAQQGRNVLLVGQPGTGKSMIAQAMSELLPATKLKDILVHPNPANSNNPKIEILETGEGRKIVEEKNLAEKAKANNQQMMIFALSFIILGALSFLYFELNWFSDVVYAAYLLLAGVMMVGMMVGARTVMGQERNNPKLLIDNKNKTKAPFVDATGARAGALLGDIKHDPLQCLLPDTEITVNGVKKPVGPIVDSLLKANESEIERDDFGYEGVVIPKYQQFKIAGGRNNGARECKVLFANRRKFKGEAVKITTESGKELVVTPEHKVFVDTNKFKEAKLLKENDEVVIFEDNN